MSPGKDPEKDKAGPSHVELFSEESVDGFPTDRPTWVAFCPECGTKLPLADHESCPRFEGREVDEDGTVVALRCNYVRRER